MYADNKVVFLFMISLSALMIVLFSYKVIKIDVTVGNISHRLQGPLEVMGAPSRYQESKTENLRCPPWIPDRSFFPTRPVRDAPVVPIAKITDHTKSVVTLLNETGTNYSICDHIAVEIEARDSLGMPKAYGGDYFRLKLYTPSPYSAVGPDFFFDYDNGTYLALFTLLWSGTIRVEVKLVHPSEAISVLRLSDWSKFNFRGGFINVVDGKKYEEKVDCGITPFRPPMCNFSANHTHGPWFCRRPNNPKLGCNNWSYSFLNTTEAWIALEESLTVDERDTFERSKDKLDTDNLSITASPTNLITTHPVCAYSPVQPTIRTRGFYLAGRWQPFTCDINSFSKVQIRQCLSGKTVHFFGDSTDRQLYLYLEKKLNCKRGTDIHGSYFCRSDSDSMIHFKFHGLPVRGIRHIPVPELGYIADEIDNLPEEAGQIIVISIWGHFGVAGGINGTFYRDRLFAVKSAIERLWKRSPDTHVIIRGANTREHTIGGLILISSDWIALQTEKTLRDVFSSDERFAFLDAWDMTLVQEPEDDMHPLEPTLTQIVNYLLTMICNASG